MSRATTAEDRKLGEVGHIEVLMDIPDIDYVYKKKEIVQVSAIVKHMNVSKVRRGEY